MKSLTRYMLVIAMVGAMLSSIVGAAGAAETDGYLTAVNGASTDPVDVNADALPLASALAYPDTGAGELVPGGDYTVTFTGGTVDSDVAVNAAAGTAQTVVSGFAAGSDTNAAAYPIDMTPIDAGMAKVTIWNATAAAVDVIVDGGSSTSVDPGDGLPTIVAAAGTPVAVEIAGVSMDIPTPEDSYTDVFAVNDGSAAAIATSAVVMTDLIAMLTPTPPTDVAVPDVVGQAQGDAESAIAGAGLVAGTTEAPDDTVPAGDVVSQDPAAGTMVPAGSTVNIVVSTGPDTSTVPVPDVVGQPEGDAQKTLEDAGFTVTSTEEASADVEIGLVISTNPSAGTEVASGTEVAMVVSSGPGDVVVPDILGMTADEATAAVEAAGLTISVVEDPKNPDPDGAVVKQDPAAGTTVEGGSEVVAQLSPDLGEPWSIVTLDQNRLMTVSGVGMLPGSTVTLSVVDTDLTESVAVQDDGSWSAKFDLSDVDNDTEFLLVEGTAADTSAYSATFKIPAAGESTEVPTDETATESSGFPLWGWILIGIALIAIVLIIVRMVQGGNDDDTTTTTDGDSTGGSGTATPDAS